MSGGNLLQQWISEYCAPVVITLASEEAERICLQNGLLLHELLSCFGHLDGLNSTIRIGNQGISVSDAHIRFERVTEVRAKSAENVDELLHSLFKPYEVNHIPNSVAEIKANPPTSWTRTTEQVFTRSLAFSEYEMLSNPVLILTVVSTSDIDPVAAMQELASVHHTPTAFSNGQYEPSIHRVYILLEDSAEKKKDPLSVLRGLNSHFPPSHTKLLVINSFPPSAPNLQQPDMWSRHLIPKYFPQHAPKVSTESLPLHPTTKQPVLGARLSVEDFMKLREFCIWLFNEQIIPILERRIANLTRQVNDSRKGVKNVLKSFWRKPREESDSPKGGVKYRFDKIESQTLYLADLSFMVKDYETALSMYKLVREDFKADKSVLHLAHALLMSAICQMVSEPHKYREVYQTLEAVSQCMQSGIESPVAHCYLALLSSEVYTLHSGSRAPLESAKILIQASSLMAKYPVISSLLMEKAATYFLQSNQARKYVFHTVIAGLKMRKFGRALGRHSTILFAVSMLLLEKGNWGELRSKMMKVLADDFKRDGREGSQRSLVFMLKILNTMIKDAHDPTNISSNPTVVDSLSIVNDVLSDGNWGAIRLNEGWLESSVREIMLGSLPITALDMFQGEDVSKSRTEVCGLALPEVVMKSVTMLEPINGYFFYDSHSYDLEDRRDRSVLIALLNVERTWLRNSKQNIENKRSLEETMIQAEKDCLIAFENNMRADAPSATEAIKIPKGERVLVKMELRNKLSNEIQLTKLHLEVNKMEDFTIQDISLVIPPNSSKDVILELIPHTLGKYTVNNVRWNLSEQFSVFQPLRKKGALLQRTLQQRANYERAKDQFFNFEVVDCSPLITLSFDGLSSEVLQGQLLKTHLLLKNDGTAPATNIYLKLSQPSFVFYLSSDANNANSGKFLDFFGYSSTIVYLNGVIINPGEEVNLEAWLRITKLGEQKISLLASYQALLSSPNEANEEKKYSYISIKTKGLPSSTLAMQVAHRCSSTKSSTLITELTNCMKGEEDEEHQGLDLSRMSSVGQYDLPDLEEYFVELDNNYTKVVGLLLVGDHHPFSRTPKPADGKEDTQFLTAAPSERISHCWPIKHQPYSIEQKRTIDDGWLVELPDLALDKSLNISHNHLKSIVEQFLIIWYAHNQFLKKLEEAKRILLLEELEASEAGPRTIQEVRRERQKISTTNGDGMETILENANDMSASNLHDHHIVYNMSNIVLKESLNNSIGISTIWVCRWQNKIRWGMHHLPFLSTLADLSEKSTASNTAAGSCLQYLKICINHSKTLVWQKNQELAEIHIQMTIKSVSSKEMSLSIQALNHDGAHVTKISNLDNDVLLSKVANLGFIWRGKSRFHNLKVPPKSEQVVNFIAEVVKPGVYNLNRFGILAEYTDDKDSHLTTETSWTVLSGQSLLFALPVKE